MLCRLENKLIAKGLELSFEPTIGNFDQEHNENWYSYLNYFTSTLTQYVPVFPSYRNQSIDLLRKSIDWFLYEGNTDT